MLVRRVLTLFVLAGLSLSLSVSPASADPPPPPPPDLERCATQSFGFEDFAVCQRLRTENPPGPSTTIDVYGARAIVELPPDPADYQLWFQPTGQRQFLLAEGTFGTQWVETTPMAPYVVACGSAGSAAIRIRWSGFSTWTDFIRTEDMRIRCA